MGDFYTADQMRDYALAARASMAAPAQREAMEVLPRIEVQLPDGDERTVKVWFTERTADGWKVSAQVLAASPQGERQPADTELLREALRELVEAKLDHMNACVEYGREVELRRKPAHVTICQHPPAAREPTPRIDSAVARLDAAWDRASALLSARLGQGGE